VNIKDNILFLVESDVKLYSVPEIEVVGSASNEEYTVST
jgi:hypothetical protein